MNISDILRHKGAQVVTIAPGDSVETLVAAFAEHDIGAAPVVEDDALLGIVSERDVVRRLAERGTDVLGTHVRDVMTTTVVSCAPGDSIDSIAATMTERRIRHMPVLDGDRLAGIVSIGDVVSSRMRQLESDRGQLEQYISS